MTLRSSTPIEASFMAAGGDFYLATGGDFHLAIDRPSYQGDRQALLGASRPPAFRRCVGSEKDQPASARPAMKGTVGCHPRLRR